MTTVSCEDSKASKPTNSEVIWDVAVEGVQEGALLKIGKINLEFPELEFEGTISGKATIYRPKSDFEEKTLGSAKGWGNARKGRPKFSASYFSRKESCRIKFAEHEIWIEEKGKKIKIDDFVFPLPEGEGVDFVVTRSGVESKKG